MPRVRRGRFPLVLIPSILFCLLFALRGRLQLLQILQRLLHRRIQLGGHRSSSRRPCTNPSGCPNSKWLTGSP